MKYSKYYKGKDKAMWRKVTALPNVCMYQICKYFILFTMLRVILYLWLLCRIQPYTNLHKIADFVGDPSEVPLPKIPGNPKRRLVCPSTKE